MWRTLTPCAGFWKGVRRDPQRGGGTCRTRLSSLLPELIAWLVSGECGGDHRGGGCSGSPVDIHQGCGRIRRAKPSEASREFHGHAPPIQGQQSFSQISGFLEPFGGAYCNPELEKVPYVEKRDFLGFFQELAIQMNSGLIPKEVVHYMFGYYAIRCWDCESFWKGVSRETLHWKLFRDFVEDMGRLDDRLSQLDTRKKLRF